MIVEAGATIQAVQDAAEAAGLFYPVDWGARGSATVGGSLATNAGGNRVIRWGMTRDSVLGVEVALADGTLLQGLNTLVKNNAGYDLKDLFVGSEGTLGVITAASLRLREKPQSHMAAFAGVPSSTQYWIQVQGALGPVGSPWVSPQQSMLPLRPIFSETAVEKGRNTSSASP